MTADDAQLRLAIDRLQIAVTGLTEAQKESVATIREMRLWIESTYVRKDVLDPTIKELQKGVDHVSGWITWAQRIVLALVIAAVVGLVLTQGGTPT